jgi:aldehyde dehydrogenase (NAD+)
MPDPTQTQFETAKTFDARSLFTRHRNYFLSGATRSIEWREKQLIALRSMMQEHAEDFYEALWSDLRRNRTEADWVDVKYMTSEITHVLEHLRHWMEPVPVSTPLMLTSSHATVQFDPLGVGLIIGTWNYPVMLTLSPLIAAISAGNAAVIKPPDLAPATSNVIDRLVPEYLDRNAFSVVLGGREETTNLLEQPWNHIFFYRWHYRRKSRHDSRGKESDSRGS